MSTQQPQQGQGQGQQPPQNNHDSTSPKDKLREKVREANHQSVLNLELKGGRR